MQNWHQKSKKRIRKPPPNPALDLFGEVPVTLPELEIWVAVIAPRISPRRVERYIHDYDVANKIRRWKIEGQFDAIRDKATDLVDCRACIGRFFHQG